MTEEEFRTEFIALRDQLPRGSKLHRRGELGWHMGGSVIYVRLDGVLERKEYLTEPDGRRRAHRIPETSEDHRATVLRAIARMLEDSRAAIAQGVATRARRREAQLAKVLKKWLVGEGSFYANRETCACCRKLLSDPESRSRGIGPECFEEITQLIEEARQTVAPPWSVSAAEQRG